MPSLGRCKLKEKIFIFSNHLGVAGTPKLAALCDSPTLSIHVPAFHRFPPNTNPVLSRTPTVTLNPALVMWLSRSGPAPRSRKLMPMKCRCITSWMTSYKGWSLNKDWFKINFLLRIPYTIKKKVLKNALIVQQILLTNYLRKPYGDQSGKLASGYWTFNVTPPRRGHLNRDQVFITSNMISHLLEDPGYRSGVDPFPQPSHLSWFSLVSYAAVVVSSRNTLSQVSWEGALRDKTKTDAIETWGSYHLNRKTGNSSWKINWFAPFRLGSFRTMSCDLKQGNFSTLVSLFSWFEYTLRSFGQQKVYSFMFMDKIFTRVIFA